MCTGFHLFIHTYTSYSFAFISSRLYIWLGCERCDENASGFCHAEKNANDIFVLLLFFAVCVCFLAYTCIFGNCNAVYLNKSSKAWYGKPKPKPITMVQFTQYLMTIKTSHTHQQRESERARVKKGEKKKTKWAMTHENLYIWALARIPCTFFQLFVSYCVES